LAMLVGVFDCCCHRHDNSTPARDGSENSITREDSVLLRDDGGELPYGRRSAPHYLRCLGQRWGHHAAQEEHSRHCSEEHKCLSADLRAGPSAPLWAEPPPEFAEFSGRGSHVLRSALRGVLWRPPIWFSLQSS
jgi:hypothetical protein